MTKSSYHPQSRECQKQDWWSHKNSCGKRPSPIEEAVSSWLHQYSQVAVSHSLSLTIWQTHPHTAGTGPTTIWPPSYHNPPHEQTSLSATRSTILRLTYRKAHQPINDLSR